jgi:hypothetical protein
MTSALELPSGKTWYPLYRRLGGPQGQSGRVWKISPPLGFNPWTVQPVTSRYTDWAIPAHTFQLKSHNTPCTGRWVGPGTVLSVVVERKILVHARNWILVVQHVAKSLPTSIPVEVQNCCTKNLKWFERFIHARVLRPYKYVKSNALCNTAKLVWSSHFHTLPLQQPCETFKLFRLWVEICWIPNFLEF